MGACNVVGQGDMCVAVSAIPGKQVTCEFKAPAGMYLSEYVADLAADVTPKQFRHAPKTCKNYVGIMNAADSNLALHRAPKMVSVSCNSLNQNTNTCCVTSPIKCGIICIYRIYFFFCFPLFNSNCEQIRKAGGAHLYERRITPPYFICHCCLTVMTGYPSLCPIDTICTRLCRVPCIRPSSMGKYARMV